MRRLVSCASIRSCLKAIFLCLIGLSRARVRSPSQPPRFLRCVRSVEFCRVSSEFSMRETLKYVSRWTSAHSALSSNCLTSSR